MNLEHNLQLWAASNPEAPPVMAKQCGGDMIAIDMGDESSGIQREILSPIDLYGSPLEVFLSKLWRDFRDSQRERLEGG